MELGVYSVDGVLKLERGEAQREEADLDWLWLTGAGEYSVGDL